MFRKFTVFKSAAACGVGLGLTALNQYTGFSPSYLRSPHGAHGGPIFSHKIVFADKGSHSQENGPVNTTEEKEIETEKVMTEEEKWALKGEQCPLCKMALASPCIAEFKVFDTCLEKLKVKYGDEKPPDDEGMECFSGFHACMFANLEFFKTYVEEKEAEEKEEEKEGSSGSTGEVEEEGSVPEKISSGNSESSNNNSDSR